MQPDNYAPASARQKAILLAFGAAIAITSAIEWAGWRTFGGYEKQVAVFAWFVGGLYVIRLLAILERR